MKFYFDGEKICTSKAHNYTHAIVSRAPQSLLIPEIINFETYYTRRKEHEKPLFLRNDPPGTRHE